MPSPLRSAAPRPASSRSLLDRLDDVPVHWVATVWVGWLLMFAVGWQTWG
jgi:hypothetical protein